jgi:hypothetical protein
MAWVFGIIESARLLVKGNQLERHRMRFKTSLEYSLAANAEMLTYRLRLAKTAISRARIWAITSSTIAILEAIYIAVNCF